jgi:hypothetical protein
MTNVPEKKSSDRMTGAFLIVPLLSFRILK